MLALLLTAAQLATAPTTNPGPGAAEARINAAIFRDIELNAWIGNGNGLISGGWVLGYNNEAGAPKIQIRDVTCDYRTTSAYCRFALARLSDALTDPLTGEPVPLLVECDARFRVSRDPDAAWWVVHKPPSPHGGHTRTTMTCRAKT